MEREKAYNAKETNTWRKQGQIDLDCNSHNKSTSKTNISSSRDESKRADRTLDKGGYVAIPKAVIGGILNRLRILENKHLKYVNAHGERLEKRLIENHTHKSEIHDDMKSLETLLVQLLEGASSKEYELEEE